MLSLFAKKTMILGAPAEGDLLDITQVSDPFFASKNLGDGIAVNPHAELVCRHRFQHGIQYFKRQSGTVFQ